MYTTASAIIDDIVSVYDNTDESGAHNLTTRRARILHYIQRTTEKLWYYRSWPFSMASATVVMVAGEGSLPTDFSRISYEGALLGPGARKPWVEIDFQSMAYMRASRVEQTSRVFAVGSKLQIPDVNNTQSFLLVYQTVAPTQVDDGSAETGLPLPFGEALLLGAVYKLKEEEGDPRPHWRQDFADALGRATALWVKNNRAQRMPNTIGGMW